MCTIAIAIMVIGACVCASKMKVPCLPDMNKKKEEANDDNETSSLLRHDSNDDRIEKV